MSILLNVLQPASMQEVKPMHRRIILMGFLLALSGCAAIKQELQVNPEAVGSEMYDRNRKFDSTPVFLVIPDQKFADKIRRTEMWLIRNGFKVVRGEQLEKITDDIEFIVDGEAKSAYLDKPGSLGYTEKRTAAGKIREFPQNVSAGIEFSQRFLDAYSISFFDTDFVIFAEITHGFNDEKADVPVTLEDRLGRLFFNMGLIKALPKSQQSLSNQPPVQGDSRKQKLPPEKTGNERDIDQEDKGEWIRR